MSTLPRQAVAAVTARPASTTLVLRDGAQGLEVLMVRRSMQASFMPGAYVFPGGAVDVADASAASQALCDEPADALLLRIGQVTEVGGASIGHAVAALRECFEECGLWLDEADPAPPVGGWGALRQRLHAGQTMAAIAASTSLRLNTRGLHPWSHWVTPVGIPKRFDTLFFVARAPAQQTPSVDESETTSLAWVHPPAALAEHARGKFQMEFATVSTVRSLLRLAGQTSQAVCAHAAAQTHLPPLVPRLKLDAQGSIVGVLLPGEAGYDDAYR